MAIRKEELHPEGSLEDVIYPKTSSDQIVDKELIRNLYLSSNFKMGDVVVEADLPNQTSKEIELKDGDFVFNYLTTKLFYYYNSQSQEIILGGSGGSSKLYLHKLDFNMGSRFLWIVNNSPNPYESYEAVWNDVNSYGSGQYSDAQLPSIMFLYVSYRPTILAIQLPNPGNTSGSTTICCASINGTLNSYNEASINKVNFIGDTVTEFEYV